MVSLLAHGADITLRGKVVDSSTGEPLPFATVRVSPGNQATHADAQGLWTLTVPERPKTVTATYIGYQSAAAKAVAGQITLKLKPSAMLDEVVVTARESQGLTSSSRIDRDAMEHLQPTSFTDILELLPGNISQNPNMGSANSITLRETGAMTATGAKTSTSDDYAITSLGTRFMVDGAPVDGDANLQGVPISDSSDPSAKRSSVNRGVDMRTISTDNIESVEIVRGIPSAEYGNLTSGLVNIKRIQRATPWTGRFKADEYSKLFSLGKGLIVGSAGNVLNMDLSYLDSKIDPRDNLENYKRVTGSIRTNLRWNPAAGQIRWNLGGDYTGSFDNAKVDPDLNYNKIDLFKSSYNRFAFTSTLAFAPAKNAWIEDVELNTSASYQRDRLEREKQVAPQRASIAPTTMEPGIHDGHYLLSEYIANFVSDGKPLSIFAKLRAKGRRSLGTWLHEYKAGSEWSIAKNYGKGQIYDLTRPLSASWTTRPRRYSDIPSLQVLSFFAEDNVTALLGASKLEIQAGLRTSQLPGIDKKYYLHGKVYLDPRANAVFTFPAFTAGSMPMRLFIAGGWGLTTKMPTVDYLYPQVHYNDLVQLNYYNPKDPENLSRVSLRTYIEDATNYELHAARNHKWEVRAGGEWGENSLSVTYFQERMTSGFRYSRIYAPYEYRRYDASGIDGTTLTAPPTLESLPWTDSKVLDGMSFVTNGTRIDKKGVEFQISTARWDLLRTRLIVSGAWLHTRYSNSQMLFTPVNDVVGNQAVSDLYVGLYNSNDGRVNDQFNTNFTFDTQIPRWGLVFTTAVQCMWWMKTTRLRENGRPDQYLSALDGLLHPYTSESEKDLMLQYLVRHYNDASYNTQTVPPAIYLNLKATKKIGRWMKISAFVNRIVDYLPDYKSNGLTVRRVSEAYFGMEMNFTL
ncbi:MAG: TonB-dependent receptor [Firmicutes bacterium]|nr:TonB-dependent receptor [Bacillota bacterium]MCM1477814.1 TonB-dependent receptor [Bacteroides sp.]